MQNIVKAALFLNTGKLDGNTKSIVNTTVTNLDAETQQTNVNVRASYNPPNIPVSFGFEFTSEVEEGEVTSAGVKVVDDEDTSTDFGIGVAGHFPNGKGLVAIEYHILSEESEDKMDPTDPDENVENKGFQFSLGGEYKVIENLWVRAGLRIKNIGEDPAGSNAQELDIKTTEFNLGSEYEFGESGSVALVYTNTSIKSDGFDSTVNAAFDVDEQEYKGNSIEVIGKFKFGRIGGE